MDQLRTLAVSLAVASLLTLQTACVWKPDSTSPPTTAPGQAPTSTSHMTLGQLQQRLLTYAGSLKQPSDVSQDAFASMLGVKLVPIEPGAMGGEAKSQPLADGYQFYASFASHSTPSSFPLHEVLMFLPGGKSLTKENSPPCVWSAERASKQLEAMGYERGGERPFQQGWMRQHWRPIGDGKQGFSANLLIYHSGPEEAPESCVYGVRYWGGDA